MKKYLLLFSVAFFAISLKSAPKVTTYYRNALVFAYSQVNSVIEDENIKLEIYNQSLFVTNKTSNTLYIDLSKCYSYHNEIATPLFSENNKKRNKHNDSEQGISGEDLFLTIAPSVGLKQKATKITELEIGLYKYYDTSEGANEKFDDYTLRLFENLGEMLEESISEDPKKKQYVGSASRHFTEDESVDIIGATVSYAFDKKSEDWKTAMLSTWVSDITFAPYFVQMPMEQAKEQKKGFGVKKSDPATLYIKGDSPFEFDDDKSPLIVCDWEGDAKDGTFSLSPIDIRKDELSLKVVIRFIQGKWGTMKYESNKNKTQRTLQAM